MRIEKQFGYKLSFYRMKKGWTEQQVADAVNEEQKDTPPVTIDMVCAWEDFESVPEQEIVQVLADILIDQNPNLAADKAVLRRDFLAAAKTARLAIASDNPFDQVEKVAAFGGMVALLRKDLNISEEDLVETLTQQEDMQFSAEDIHKIQYGLMEVGIRHKLALANALEVPEEEKADFCQSTNSSGMTRNELYESKYQPQQVALIAEMDAFFEQYRLESFANVVNIIGSKEVFKDRRMPNGITTSYFLSRNFAKAAGAPTVEALQPRKEQHIRTLTEHLFDAHEEQTRKEGHSPGVTTANSGSGKNKTHIVGIFDKEIQNSRLTEKQKTEAQEQWQSLCDKWLDLNRRWLEDAVKIVKENPVRGA